MRSPKSCMAAAVLAVVVGLTVGCDTEKSRADKAASRSLEKAAIARGEVAAEGATTAQIAAANLKASQTELQTAVSSARNARPSTLANANQALAVNKLSQVLLAEADFNAKTREIISTLLAIQSDLEHLGVRQATIAGAAKLDPASTIAALKKSLTDLQGGTDPTWKTTNEEVALPTLASTQQKVADLEGRIAAARQQIATIDQNRAKAVSDAEQSIKSAEGAQGQASVDAFVNAANLRHQAEDLGIDKEVLEKNITRLSQDLEAAKNLQAGLTSTAAELQKRIDALETGWKATQGLVDKDKQTQASMISGTDAAGPLQSLKTLDGKLDTQLTEWRDLKNALLNDLDEAGKSATDAVSAANATRQSITEGMAGPFRSEWAKYKVSVDSSIYGRTGAATTNEAAVIQSLASAVLGQLIRLQTQAATVVPAADLGSLKTLGAKDAISKEFDEAVSAADGKFKEAGEALTQYEAGEGPDFVRQMAKIEHLLNLAQTIAHRELAGKWGKTYSADEAPDKLLETAKTTRDELVADNVSLPPLAGELGKGKPVTATPVTPTPETPGATPATPGTPGTPTDTTPGATPATPGTPTDTAPGATPTTPATPEATPPTTPTTPVEPTPGTPTTPATPPADGGALPPPPPAPADGALPPPPPTDNK